MSFAVDMSRSNLCFALCLLERVVQVTTYDFGFMDNSITNEFDRSIAVISVRIFTAKFSINSILS
jgi:hypothetical protein